MKRDKIAIATAFIKLDSFLKFAGVADTGSGAKAMVLDGQVLVDGEVCLMRGKKLYPGMVVSVDEQEYEVVQACG